MTQGATQLYAESRRSGSGGHAQKAAPPAATARPSWQWLAAAGGAGLAIGAAGFWAGTRRRDRSPASQGDPLPPVLEPVLVEATDGRDRAIDSRS